MSADATWKDQAALAEATGTTPRAEAQTAKPENDERKSECKIVITRLRARQRSQSLYINKLDPSIIYKF